MHNDDNKVKKRLYKIYMNQISENDKLWKYENMKSVVRDLRLRGDCSVDCFYCDIDVKSATCFFFISIG